MKKCLFASLLLLLPALCFGLTVDAPTAGELIPAGSVYTSIQWTPTAGSTKFNVYASFDNGLTWSTPLNKTGKVSDTKVWQSRRHRGSPTQFWTGSTS